ncbi:hypothetical protein [Jiangella mangrovi]|uniref:Uncharacterized protein n=1 Tax=Jiangella mangrovi TaxID=1524084 RepID=A0A7W9GSM2_9ACTN|nr:hypothetical protein [Jiangella mangrovi]MBB5789315.1 hypothetical protein [Jiangella mangrovi]
MTMRDGADDGGRDDGVLDLGVVGPGGDPDAVGPDAVGPEAVEPSRRARAWRRWALVAATLLVGGLLGAVVTDARHDAAELARVGLISGPVNWIPADDGTGAATVDLQIVNIGAQPVEIVGIATPGFEIAPGTEPLEPVEAPVGDWVVVEQPGLVADCEAEPPTGVDVLIRNGDGDERTVRADQNDSYGSIDMYWVDQCEFSAGYVQFLTPPTSVQVADDALTVTTPLLNYSGRPVQVTNLVPMASGFTATVPPLPIALTGHNAAQVELTWTVADCAAAMSIPGDGGRIEFTVQSGTHQRPESNPLDGPTMVELVRLAGRVCG